ncbi:protocatechuate 3,4-dioxygenase subunit alpha [Nesterenkonia flava]|uniref:Protocatechuate 3,4-dioxygenase subunit alpha n=1 Tax=Nesterenkonia flava TaxID=469799 RepID=A0ABU1FPK8_9MICC|nr:protocatechuate 3,4-dioxygenase subunit alpha [Nesterenkonia flava]MDR5710581.1 protocatechuate 3,4-dioxygenase subunit alpha [Nesterenkonia flava]
MTRTTALPPTPGQTVGPFYGYALPFEGGPELIRPSDPRAVRLYGTVRDAEGTPVPDALLEIWQPDDQGRISQETGSLHRDGYTFTGFGRAEVNRAGEYQFITLNPGATDEGKAPFILMTVFARGLLDRLFTRIYLPEHRQTVEEDPALSGLSAEDRHRLFAHRDEDGGLRFDVHLAGESQTVFFDYGH